MIRAIVGLSQKVSKDYNSKGYSINLDGEITVPTSDPEGVIEQIKELFDLADEALSQQIDRSGSETAITVRDEASVGGNAGGNQSSKPHGGPNGHGNSNGHDEPATNKQINYLLSIGKRQNLSTPQLERKVAEILGRQMGLYDLTKQAAGTVIDALTKKSETVETVGTR